MTKSISKIRAVSVLCIGGLMATTPANAFWGIGDVTFDPTNYAELVAHGKQIMDLYNSAMQQLDRLSKIQDTISKAYSAYDRLTNIDLHSMADGLKPGQYMKNSRGTQVINDARSELGRLKGNAQGDVYYVKDQLSRLDDLEKMIGLQSVAADNAKQASTDLDQRKSSQITAQSTSVLAALASAEEQRRQEQVVAQSAEQQQQKGLTGKSADLYKSLSGAK